jgi:hypothetical protein
MTPGHGELQEPNTVEAFIRRKTTTLETLSFKSFCKGRPFDGPFQVALQCVPAQPIALLPPDGPTRDVAP